MKIHKIESPGSSLIYIGLGLSAITLAAIAYWAENEDAPMGRLGTLATVGLRVGIASFVAGMVTKLRGRRR